MRDACDVFVHQRTAFVGRVSELATLDAVLASSRDGGPGVVLVAGEAGIGKSRLIAELRVRAEAAGALLATGRTPIEGAALPYSAVVGLLRDLGRKIGPRETADLLEPVQRLLTDSSSEGTPGAIARLQLFEATLHAIEGLAVERPSVFVLEDLHWADAGTVELLDYLVHNLDGHPVLIAATYRPDEVERRPPLRRVLLELRRDPRVTTLALSGLSRDETSALVTDVAGEPQSWTVVDAIHRRSEGNPLFAEELVAVRHTTEFPSALRDLMAVRIEQLPPDARTVVAAASVLGVSCDHRLLAAVGDLDPAVFDAALAEAVRNHVLAVGASTRSVRFRHALLQEAAHAELLPAERARLHGRAAEAITVDASLVAAGPGHAAAELAEHYFEAGDWASACETSITAARASLSLYALSAAHAHLERAVEAHRLAAGACRHTDVDDVELYRMAAEAASLASQLDQAYELAVASDAALVALGPSVPASRAVASSLLLARSAWDCTRHETAFAALNEAEARLGDERGGRDAAEVSAARARLLMLVGRFTEAIESGEDALETLQGVDAAFTEGHVLATLGPCLAEAGQTERALEVIHRAIEVAEEVGHPELLIRAYNNFVHVFSHLGRLDDVAKRAVDAMDDTSALGLVRLAGFGYNAIELLTVLGRWQDAERVCTLMEGRASAACPNDSHSVVLLALRRGDLDRAEAELDRYTPSAPVSVANHELLRAEIALERGQPTDALSAIDRGLAAIAGADFFVDRLNAYILGLRALADQDELPVRPGRRASTDPAKSARIAESMLAEVDAAGTDAPASPWTRALTAQGRAEATRILGPDPDAWRRAADLWDALHAVFNIAYCRLRYAEAVLATRGNRRDATAALVDAWRTAGRLGAPLLARACQRLADRAGIALDDSFDETPSQRAASDLGLTRREVEVLDLLARERTDGQIAEELFISKKTASVHVSNILRKLEARDRWHAGEIGRTAGLGDAD